MMAVSTMTPERLSVMVGVLAAMLATLPRYVVVGDQNRLWLILFAFIVVAAVVVISARMLPERGRRRLPGLLGRLLVMLPLGCVIVALWQWFEQGMLLPLLLLSHGVTVGLLLHALTVGWRRSRHSDADSA